MKILASVLISVCVVVQALDRARLEQRARSQPGFQLSKYLGRWYIQARLRPCSWSGSDKFQEMFQDLEMQGKTIIVTENWYNCVCTKTTALKTPTKRDCGTFIVKDTFGDVWSGDNTVVATDYKTFSITRGCTKQSVDGNTCEDYYVSAKTRTPHPLPYTWKKIETILKKLYDLSLSEMRRINHRNPKCYH